MNIYTLIPASVIIICVFIYTVSYGVFVWKQKNRLGGAAVMLIALAEFLMPLLTLLIRG